MSNLMALRFRWSAVQRTGLALIIILLALWLRFLILPVSSGYPFVTLYPATVGILFFCGLMPGLIVMVLSAIAGFYFFVPPHFAMGVPNGESFVVVQYLVATSLTALILYPLQRYIQRAYVALEKLRDSESRFRSFMDNSSFIAWMKDDEGRYVFMSKPCEELFERPPESWTGRTDFEIFPAEFAQSLREHDARAMASQRAVTVEESAVTPDGKTLYWFSSRFRYVDSAGQNFVGGIAIDITERKNAEKLAENLAFYDPLTDLPNRRLLTDRLARALHSAVRQNELCALLFIDLDNFKTLNDTFGHKRGDQLLIHVAQRLSQSVRKSDTLARLGGDEFVVLLEHLSITELDAANEAQAVAEKILTSLSQAYTIDDNLHSSTPSIGITLFGDVEEAVEEPLRRADLAMYEAKAAGRNTFRFFDPKLQESVAKRTYMEADLRSALRGSQLLLHYQAQVDAGSMPFAAEVLLRWQHPERGMISPLEFIPIAEDSGLILEIGRWVLDTACAQLAAWSAHPVLSRVSIAINVSLRQFYQPDFVSQVLASVTKAGANPQRLKLELTESLLAVNVEDVIEKMTALKAQGIGFSLDDFGTGYSSLAYLKRLPLDQLKIDQSFVRDTLIDANDAAIVRTIIALADSLNLAVIAEGVETEDQRRFLSQSGCNTYQGYLFSEPLPVRDFEQYFADSHGKARN